LLIEKADPLQFRNLEIFCTVAEKRSFSRAADAHGITQSAVSQAMQHLEESLEVQLIDRSKRPLLLTEAGKAYLHGLRGILGSYHRLEQEVVRISKRLSGQVTVGSIYSVGLSYMPEATEAFVRLHPGVDVRTEFGESQRVVEMTEGGEVDFGLVSFPERTPGLDFVAWQKEPMRLVCSARHPWASKTEVTIGELSRVEMIGFDRRLTLRQEIDRCLFRAGVTVSYRMEFDNCDSIVRAIQANRAVGIVPEAAVRRETADGTLRVVACRQFQMKRPLGIIFRRSGRLSTAAGEFGSLLLGRPLESERRRESERKHRSGGHKPAVENTPNDRRGERSLVF
jgi:DNA-binding transcriptional LysR family regulator